MPRIVYHFYLMVLMNLMFIYLKVHLFVLNKEKRNKYQTDNYGGRLLYDEALNNKIQVFGDSQVLGLDVENIRTTLFKYFI